VKHSPIALELFSYAKRLMRRETDSLKETVYITKSELLWSGKHYLLIREGPYQGSRGVELWSVEALLLQKGNPTKNGMLEIALASIDPIHRKWKVNKRRTLACSAYASVKAFRGRRYSKTLCRELIAYCEEQERDFKLREAEEIKHVDDYNEFSKNLVLKAKSLGFEISGAEIGNDPYKEDSFLADRTYSTSLHMSSTTCERFRFKPTSSKKVVLKWSQMTMTGEEFEVLLEAVAQINTMRKEESNEDGV